MDWVLGKKLSELTGYTEEAISQKRKKGVWCEGVHCRKAPDGRIFYSIEAVRKWIEGKA